MHNAVCKALGYFYADVAPHEALNARGTILFIKVPSQVANDVSQLIA